MTLTKNKKCFSMWRRAKANGTGYSGHGHRFNPTGCSLCHATEGEGLAVSSVPGNLNYSLWLGVWLGVKALAWIHSTQGLIPSKTQNPKLTSFTVFSGLRIFLGGCELEEGGPREAGIMRRAQGTAGTAAAPLHSSSGEGAVTHPLLPGNPGLSSSCCLVRYWFALKGNASLEQCPLGFVVVVCVLSLPSRSFLFHTLEQHLPFEGLPQHGQGP